MRHRRMNPEGILASAKEGGVAVLQTIPAAAVVGLGMLGASKIDYPVSANDTFSPASKRAMLVGVGSVVLGILAQMSGKTEAMGKALIGVGVGAPVAVAVASKVAEMSAPSAAQPLVAAPSSGMYALGRQGFAFNALPAPSGFAADSFGFVPSGELSSSIASPTFIPRG